MARFGFSGFGSARDAEYNERDRDRATRKRRKVIRSAHEPMIPFFCSLLFYCMIGAPLLDLLVELVTAFRGTNPAHGMHLAVTIVWSVLVIWVFFAVMLVILSDIQLVRTVKNGYEERVYYFEDEIPKGTSISEYERVEQPEIDASKDADLILYSKKADYDTRKKYLRYVLISGGGAAILGVLYFVLKRVAG